MALSGGSIVAGRYRVLERLGEGGFGAVYLVEHLHLAGQKFALKVLTAGLAPAMRQRFEQEATILLKLVHPSIVLIRDFAIEGDFVCYAMDYVKGPSLRDLLAKERSLALPRALARTREVLEALSVAHAEAVVHRDVKPENVMLASAGTPAERAKVLDFGIAKLLEADPRHTHAGPIGTPAYMSPEQADGESGVDARTDIYATGCMLFELLTGRTPFISASLGGYLVQHRFEPPPSFAEAAPEKTIPAPVEAVVRRALEKEPARRFQSAEEMIGAIDALGILARHAAPTATGLAEQRTLNDAGGASGTFAAPSVLDWKRPLSGQAVDQFRIVRTLGEGGFGVVCEAVDVTLERRVALKLLKPDIASQPTIIERFAREAKVLAGFEHDSIVRVYAARAAGGACYIAMEFLEGETLGGRLSRAGPLPPAEVARVMRPTLDALQAAHARGIVHRDLKPDNVFLLRDGRVKVLDFGIASILRGEGQADQQQLTMDGAILGTVAYLSPEQALGDRVDGRSDLYSCGAILFELLTGRRLYPNLPTSQVIIAHVKTPAPTLREARPQGAFSDALEAVVARALAKKRDARFPDAAALSAALDAAAGVAPPPRPSPGAPGAGEGSSSESMTLCVPQTAIRPPPGGPLVGSAFRGRARIDLPAGVGVVRTVFVIAAPRLRFGRSRPDQDPAAAENALVLRVLPCRSPALDPANMAATRRISSSHATIEARGAAAVVTDHSSQGTTLDGAPLAKGAAVPLPARFKLGLAGALTLAGRVARGADGNVDAVLLARVDNVPEHAYLWVVRAALLGPEEGAALEVPAALRGRIEVRGAEIHAELPAGLRIQAAEIGAETRSPGESGG